MSDREQPTRWVRTRQAAERIGLSPRTLERYRVVGGGPPYHKAGPRLVLYDVDELDQWLGDKRFASTSEYEAVAGR